MEKGIRWRSMGNIIEEMKIVCISNGPLPYHTPIFNALACISDFEVIYIIVVAIVAIVIARRSRQAPEQGMNSDS